MISHPLRSSWLRVTAVLLAVGVQAACGTSSSEDDAGTAALVDAGLPEYDAGPCNVDIRKHDIQATVHVPQCSYQEWTTNPPSSGPHYPSWVAWDSYDVPIPRGFWLHDLEHGGVAVLYDCPEGCDGEVEQAQGVIDGLKGDPACVAPGPKNRVVMTPDPLIDQRWAAAAWGFTLTADCFDADLFRLFLDSYQGAGPENFCSNGFDPVTPDGSTSFPPRCGDADAGTFDAGPADAPSMDASDDAPSVSDSAPGG